MGAMAYQITSLTIVYSSFIQAQIKENIKAPRHWLWAGNSPVQGIHRCGEFTAQMASSVKNVSIWWRRHDKISVYIVAMFKMTSNLNITFRYVIRNKHEYTRYNQV